jgi:hypothetical protein
MTILTDEQLERWLKEALLSYHDDGVWRHGNYLFMSSGSKAKRVKFDEWLIKNGYVTYHHTKRYRMSYSEFGEYDKFYELTDKAFRMINFYLL